MAPEALIRATFEEVTYLKAPCLPDTKLCLDAPDIEDDESDLQEFVDAFSHFLKLTPDDLRKAAPYAFAMFKDFEDAVDPSCLDVVIDDQEGVWREIDFRNINLVRGGGAENHVYVQLAAECSWDPEHGIQFVFRNGNELTRVSEQDGHYSTCDTPGLPERDDVA